MSEEERDDEDNCSSTVSVAHHDEASSANNNDSDNNSGDDTTRQPHDDQSEQIKTNLRRGKWTHEEEAYARAVINDFHSGYLDAPIGTTLRSYLSGKLECDPMRITKKFTKDDSIGKKVYRPAPQNNSKVAKEVEVAQAKVAALYQNWKRRVETQQEETNRNSSAEPSLTSGIAPTSGNPTGIPPQRNGTLVTPNTMTLIHKTADWLEKAESILSKSLEVGKPADDSADEMKRVKLLIEEGPTILAAVGGAAKRLKDSMLNGLPSRLHSCPDFGAISVSSPTSRKRKNPLIDDELVRNYDSNPINLLASLSSRAARVPISNWSSKQRKTKGGDNTEDAKAFVDFLQSVAHE